MPDHWVALLLMLSASLTNGRGRQGCKVTVGVLDIGDWRDFAKTAWDYMVFQKHFDEATMTFIPLSPRHKLTIDVLIEAYMDLGSKNISAIIGPFLPVYAVAARKFFIPYFVTDIRQPEETVPPDVVPVLPLPSCLAAAAVDVVQRYHWSNIAVLYQSHEGLSLIEQLTAVSGLHVRSWGLNSPQQADMKRILLAVRQLGLKNIILTASPEMTSHVLRHAIHLSMLSSRYSWIMAGLNQSATLDLTEYMYTGVNLTMFDIIKDNFLRVNKVLRSNNSVLEFAVAHDAVLSLYHGIVTHHRIRKKCIWSGEFEIGHILSRVVATGATGQLSYTESLRRRNFGLVLKGLVGNRKIKVGEWFSDIHGKSHLTLHSLAAFNISASSRLDPQPVNVVTILEPPFVQLKKDHQNRQGNDRFEGYCIELMEHIAKLKGFKYEIYVVADGQYGGIGEDGTWTGMVGEIVSGNASLALGPLTINVQREHVIDFTKPFMSLGISLVMRRQEQHMSIFHFMEPLSMVIWILLLAVLLTVSMALFLVERNAIATEHSGKLGAAETTWFIFMSLVRANSEIVPKTLAGRVLSGSLSLFALIIISSYTANLAAFLTVSKLYTPIKTITDLPGQNDIKYGTVLGSEVSSYFEKSKLDFFQQMWTYMSAIEPSNMVSHSEDGFRRVADVKGAYAFIWDSPVVAHRVSIDCDLVQVGQPFASKSYGIGVPLGAAYRDTLSMAILELSDTGTLERLRTRWWGQSQCPDNKTPAVEHRALSLGKVKGIFIVLGAGLTLALIVALLEYIYRRRRQSGKSREKLRRADASPSSKPLCDGDTAGEMHLQTKLNSCHVPNDHVDRDRKATDIF